MDQFLFSFYGSVTSDSCNWSKYNPSSNIRILCDKNIQKGNFRKHEILRCHLTTFITTRNANVVASQTNFM